MAEETQHYKTYRLVLDFEVWVNDEILAPYADEQELDEEERQQLTAQRRLLQAILADKQGIYEELLRKRVLEEAECALDEEMKERLLIRNVPDTVLLEPLIERLPQAERLFLLQAIEDETFENVAGEAIYSVGVELAGVSLCEVEGEQEP
jgi:hypothetical protein